MKKNIITLIQTAILIMLTSIMIAGCNNSFGNKMNDKGCANRVSTCSENSNNNLCCGDKSLAPVIINNSDSSLQISEYVRRIFQDKNGNIWCGTNDDGVCRYDGKTLTYFSGSLPPRVFQSMMESHLQITPHNRV